MKSNYKLKKTKFSIKKYLLYLLTGFIVGNYLLYNGYLNNIGTKLTRLFAYDSIKTNIVVYEIQKRK